MIFGNSKTKTITCLSEAEAKLHRIDPVSPLTEVAPDEEYCKTNWHISTQTILLVGTDI